MSQILLVTHVAPKPMRSGGEHRTYQILRDLEKVVGQGNVILFDPRQPARPSNSDLRSVLKIPWRVKHLVKRIGEMRENASQIFLETGFSMKKFTYRGSVERYEEAIRKVRPAVCVVQHAACAWMVPINKKQGIPTIACPQNLDAIDQSIP